MDWEAKTTQRLLEYTIRGCRRYEREKDQAIFIGFVSVALGLGFLSTLSEAQTKYPTRPIQFICPWGAGGGTDCVARMLAILLEKDLGQPVTVANRTGGGGAVGHTAGIAAAPDGYTMTIVTVEITMMHWMGLARVSYKDFKPVAFEYRDDEKKRHYCGNYLHCTGCLHLYSNHPLFLPPEKGHPGPDLFPNILVLLFIGFGIALILKARKVRSNEMVDTSQKPMRISNALFVFGIAIAYVAVVNTVGFLITSAVLLFLLMKKLGVTIFKSAIASIIITLFINLMFSKILRSHSPMEYRDGDGNGCDRLLPRSE